MKKLSFIITLFCSILISYTAISKEEPVEEESVDNSIVIDRIGNDDIEVTMPAVIFTFTDAEIGLKFKNPNHTKLLLNKNKVDLIINGENRTFVFIDGKASFCHRFNNSKTISMFVEDFSYTKTVTAYPLWAIILPIVLILLWIIKKMMKKKKE